MNMDQDPYNYIISGSATLDKADGVYKAAAGLPWPYTGVILVTIHITYIV